MATLREAVDSGIGVLDLAPSYGNGEAETVIGDAFDGGLPSHVRVTTKCRVGNAPPDQIYDLLSESLNASLQHMKLDHVDVMFLHNWVTLEGEEAEGTTTSQIVAEAVAPAFERLAAEGRIRYWGLTGIGEPEAIIRLLNYGPRPGYVQCIANLLDSAGGLRRFTGPARPREIIAAANANSVAVMGIRAVQAGALTSAFDRPLPADHPDTADYDRAAPFREIAAELGDSPAYLAHRYALSVPGVSTVVLGVKDRRELRECIAAEAAARSTPPSSGASTKLSAASRATPVTARGNQQSPARSRNPGVGIYLFAAPLIPKRS